MIRCRPIIIFNILFLLFAAAGAIAQPTLPDMAGAVENGTVRLSWNCQYDGVKAISVLRSADSTGNFSLIGFVKKTAKGIHAFEDKQPMPGKNFYKLSLVFSSGLNWRTNYYGVYVTKIAIEQAKPAPARDTIPHPPPVVAIIDRESDFRQKPQRDTVKKPPTTRPDLTVSYPPDTVIVSKPEPVKPKIRLTYEDRNDNGYNIESRYFTLDPVTGNINMSLPPDVATHHYYLKFYDMDNHIIFELPRINSAKIIFDKHNFQHKGRYKFVLRKDVTELESGYMVITPNP